MTLHYTTLHYITLYYITLYVYIYIYICREIINDPLLDFELLPRQILVELVVDPFGGGDAHLVPREQGVFVLMLPNNIHNVDDDNTYIYIYITWCGHLGRTGRCASRPTSCSTARWTSPISIIISIIIIVINVCIYIYIYIYLSLLE